MPNPPRFTLPPALFARVEALRAAAHPAAPSRQAVVEAALGRGLACLESGPDADEAMVPGMTREVVYGVGEVGPGGPSLKTILLGREPTPVEQALALVDALAAQVADLAWVRLGTGEPRRYQCQGCDAERLEWEPGRHVDGCEVERLLARAGGAAGARGGADGREGVGRAGDAPTGRPGPVAGRDANGCWNSAECDDNQCCCFADPDEPTVGARPASAGSGRVTAGERIRRANGRVA